MDKEPMSAKPLGKTLLRIAGALQSIFAVIAIRDVLPSSIMLITERGYDSASLVALFLIFSPLCLCLFSGIFGVVTSNDLKKARTLRMLAIITIVLFGVIRALGAWVLPTLYLIIGLALLIPFFIGAQINYMEYKRLPQQQMSGRRLH